jgi:uncharacterized protein YidB (DUF937 family)
MALMDGLLSGLVAGNMTSAVNGLIEKHGGVQGMVALLEHHGLGSTVRSWVGSGSNLPITADQLQKVFGKTTLESLAARAGLHPQYLAHKLAQALPQAVDKLTPAGYVQRDTP